MVDRKFLYGYLYIFVLMYGNFDTRRILIMGYFFLVTFVILVILKVLLLQVVVRCCVIQRYKIVLGGYFEY